jgi:hypothetical protein
VPWVRAATAAAILVACGSAATLAAPPSAVLPARRVLLIVDRSDDPFAERIRAEVAGLGLTVLTLEVWRSHESLGPLETVARTSRAVAAIRMLPSGKGVEVWMADETSGRSLLRQLIVDESPHGPNQSLIALQTAELLRTSLLSQPHAPPVTAGGRATTSAATGGTEPSPTLVGTAAPVAPVETDLGVALGALLAPGAGDTALQAWLSLQRSLEPRWALALDLSAPLRAATLSGPEGSARVGAYLAGATLLASLTRPGSDLLATAGAGLAIVDVRADGQTSAPLRAASASAVAAGFLARADASYEIARWFRLGLRAVAGVTVPGISLRFAGNDAGTWGRPFLGGFLLAELCWR